MRATSALDLVIVGAGPIGLEAGIRAKGAGLAFLVLDEGPVVHAISRYPTYMTFFTTSERLEIGGHPLVTATDKPTRKEALDYYRKVVQNEALPVRTYTHVRRVEPCAGEGFVVHTRDEHGRSGAVEARAVMLATGYFGHPKRLGVPGEDLPHVRHAFDEAHPSFGRDVLIVGAGSSAADAALDLYRAGARVTVVHRGATFRPSLKYWIRPNLENRVKEGSITAHFHTVVRAITPELVALEQQSPEQRARRFDIGAQRVYLLTGYYAPPDLLHSAGARTHPETLAAVLDPASFETTVPGLYCIGSAGFGTRTSDVFIENGLVHAERAVAHLVARLGAATAGSGTATAGSGTATAGSGAATAGSGATTAASADSTRGPSAASATRSTRTPDPTT